MPRSRLGRLSRSARSQPLVRVALGVLVLGLLAFAGTVLYLWSSGAWSPQPAPMRAEQPVDRGVVQPLAPINLTTIEIPNEAERLQTWGPEPYRPPRERWSTEDVDRFWIDPGQIGSEYLSDTNRQLIEELLQGVP